MTNDGGDAVLELSGLTVVATSPTKTTIVDAVSLRVPRGEIVAVVGESGCGKTMTMQAVLGLLPPGVETTVDRFLFEGEAYESPARRRRLVRERRIGLIPSDAALTLNPLRTVGRQMGDGIKLTIPEARSAARRTSALDLLRRVGLPDPVRASRSYPHELSGGMQQRAAIAMGIEPGPALLIADEPTTALDVTIQAQILKLLLEIRDETGCAILFVSHDITAVAEISDRVVVMYAGQIVEAGTVAEVCMHPRHPYTAALIGTVPPLGGQPPNRLEAIGGAPPQPGAWPAGCRFAPRCQLRAQLGSPDECDTTQPDLSAASGGTVARCHFLASDLLAVSDK